MKRNFFFNDSENINEKNRFLDLSELEEMAKAKISELNLKWQKDYVMNGVAYDSQNDRYIKHNIKLFYNKNFIE